MWVACVKQAIRCLGRGPGEDKEEHKPHLDEAEYVQQLFEAAGQIDLSFKMRVVNSLKASAAKHPALQRRRRGILGLSSTLNIQPHTQEAGDDQSVARRSRPLAVQEPWDMSRCLPATGQVLSWHTTTPRSNQASCASSSSSVWASASLSSSAWCDLDSSLQLMRSSGAHARRIHHAAETDRLPTPTRPTGMCRRSSHVPDFVSPVIVGFLRCCSPFCIIAPSLSATVEILFFVLTVSRSSCLSARACMAQSTAM